MIGRLIGYLLIASNEVRYTLRARADLAAIFADLTGRSPSYAQAVRQEIRHRIGQLTDFPQMGPATDEPGVRELTLIRYPYKIYYEAGAEEVRILHVRDARRRPPDRLP